ncbi:MAG: DUF5615 family PIN-like protein [Planctomycetes bacterium]|nr:DUF5615 family PIN-like protein [Planctomycetota bacterium]
MLRLISDEDVHGDLIRDLQRREPQLDLVRALDVGLDHTPDELILEWAAVHIRLLLTGDVNSMVGFAWARVRAGLPMSGVLALRENAPRGQTIDDILVVINCQTEEEVKDRVLYIPL